MENGDEETAVSLTSGETSIVHLLLKDLLAICKKLEEIGEDALILYTGAQHVLGTSIGAMFVEPSSKILTKFQQFCKDRKNNPADRQIASDNTGTKEPVLNSLTVEEFINTHKPDHFSIFDEFNNDIDDDDDDDVEHSIVIENIMSIKEMPIIKAENTVDDLDGKLDKNSKQPLVSDAIKQVHKHSLRKVTENVQLIDKSLEKKLAVKIEQNDEVHSIENPATVLEESDGLNFSENPTRVFLDSLEIVSAEEAKLHSKSRTCSCYKCDKVLRSIGRLREHLTKVHKIKVGHKCVCGKFFSDEISFEAHKKSQKYRQMHHNCKQCNEVLTSEMALLMHVKQTHEKISILELDDFGEYPCEKCGSVFKHKYHLLSHNKKLLNCDKDMDETNNSTEKSVHNEIIQYEDPFDGNMISKTYKELIVAQKKAPWRCIICNSSYKRKSNFTRHMLTHMKADASRHICDICGKRFTSKECLTRHEKQHDSKPYSCTMSNLCKQKFGTELELTQHIKNQCKSGDRENCRCVICGQQLQSISALVIHQNMHSGYKPYKCDICGKCVTSSGSLERHKISVHQEETHFQCDTCQKRFKTKDNFKKHMKTHEEPKYHCEMDASMEWLSLSGVTEDGGNQSPQCGEGLSPHFNEGLSPHFDEGQSPQFSEGQSSSFSEDQLPQFGEDQAPHFDEGQSALFGEDCVFTVTKYNSNRHPHIKIKSPNRAISLLKNVSSGTPRNLLKTVSPGNPKNLLKTESPCTPKSLLKTVSSGSPRSLSKTVSSGSARSLLKTMSSGTPRSLLKTMSSGTPRNLLKTVSSGSTSKNTDIQNSNDIYICEKCGKVFKSKFGLLLHRKNKHLNVFKHLCNVCGKGFNQMIQYRSHYLQHEGIAIGKCEFCKQTFTGHGSLKRHALICAANPDALMEKRFICETCQASFASEDRLRYHKKGKHERPRYKCTLCEKRFSWRSSLSFHKKHSHKLIYNTDLH